MSALNLSRYLEISNLKRQLFFVGTCHETVKLLEKNLELYFCAKNRSILLLKFILKIITKAAQLIENCIINADVRHATKWGYFFKI